MIFMSLMLTCSLLLGMFYIDPYVDIRPSKQFTNPDFDKLGLKDLLESCSCMS